MLGCVDAVSLGNNHTYDFGEKGYIEFTDDNEPKFTGESVSFSDFMRGTQSLNHTSGMSLM